MKKYLATRFTGINKAPKVLDVRKCPLCGIETISKNINVFRDKNNKQTVGCGICKSKLVGL